MNLHLWHLTTWRRKLFERFGSDRYSRPASYGVEEKLLRHFTGPGFFVEAGAVDGFFESNTYYLERFGGWSGILIEPSPTMFARIPVNRPQARAFNCALVPFDYTSPTVTFTDAHALSGVFDPADPEGEERLARAKRSGAARTIQVPARTLESVLVEAGVKTIDLLSLDVEGFEGMVLRGLDFEVHRPRFILVECLTQERKAEMDELLAPRYDFVDSFSYRDFFYRAKND